MSAAELTGILVVACGALLAGMAGLIKAMVLRRLDEIQATVIGLSQDMHRMDIRLTRLEAEHRMNQARCGGDLCA